MAQWHNGTTAQQSLMLDARRLLPEARRLMPSFF